jgi:hypothetical protein
LATFFLKLFSGEKRGIYPRKFSFGEKSGLLANQDRTWSLNTHLLQVV